MGRTQVDRRREAGNCRWWWGAVRPSDAAWGAEVAVAVDEHEHEHDTAVAVVEQVAGGV